ncbi:MAG: immunity 17 family protein [Bacteroidales bacterium]|nr:immunity 17 family protein [Bacteroidales bacterium]
MLNVNLLTSGIFFLIGGFSVAAAMLNWNWFFESSNASIFVKWFGRSGARWLYFIVGILIIVVASILLGGEIAKNEIL